MSGYRNNTTTKTTKKRGTTVMLNDQPVVPRHKPYKPRKTIYTYSDAVLLSIFDPKSSFLTIVLLSILRLPLT